MDKLATHNEPNDILTLERCFLTLLILIILTRYHGYKETKNMNFDEKYDSICTLHSTD